MKSFKKKMCAVLTIGILAFSFPMYQAHAILEMSYGGQRFVTIICTCTANELLYVYDFKTRMLKMLLYQPGLSIFYQWYNTFATYLLGTYAPVATNQCQIYVYSDCETLQNNGQFGMFPGSGTSGL